MLCAGFQQRPGVFDDPRRQCDRESPQAGCDLESRPKAELLRAAGIKERVITLREAQCDRKGAP